MNRDRAPLHNDLRRKPSGNCRKTVKKTTVDSGGLAITREYEYDLWGRATNVTGALGNDATYMSVQDYCPGAS